MKNEATNLKGFATWLRFLFENCKGGWCWDRPKESVLLATLLPSHIIRRCCSGSLPAGWSGRGRPFEIISLRWSLNRKCINHWQMPSNTLSRAFRLRESMVLNDLASVSRPVPASKEWVQKVVHQRNFEVYFGKLFHMCSGWTRLHDSWTRAILL